MTYRVVTLTLSSLVVLVATAHGQRESATDGSVAATAKECFPACRSGYVCDAGMCVEPPDPSDRAHDGFFLRFEVGPGYADARLGDVEAHGIGYQYGAAIGAAVVENLVVMLSGYELIARDAETSLDAAEQVLFGQDIRTDLGIREATLGAGYYLMPVNIFLGAHVGLGFAQINANGIQSNMGFAAGLDLTKEWWVGSAWGLGVGLRLVWMKLPLDERFRDTSESDDVEVLAARLSFVATFN